MIREQPSRSAFPAGFRKAACHAATLMGDKSPKATQKKAGQNKAKATDNSKKKTAATDAKKVVKK